MPKPRVVAIVIYDGFQILDATGPGQVFATANALSGQALYDLRVVAPTGGPIRANGGMTLLAGPLGAAKPHTVIVSGGDEPAVVAAARNKPLIRWIATQAKTAKRLCSVCSGAFLLAAAGALEGKRAATHWAGAEALSRMFPDTYVERDAIYVQDGKIWTSAGVTTGIDMALALVAADHGRDLAARVARQLVVYMHRPGHQSQFSDALQLQSAGDVRMQRLADWVELRLNKDLRVEAMATAAGMSLRSFHRHLKSALKTTPKRWVEDFRLSRARALLEDTAQGLGAVAGATGFSSSDHLIKAFDRRLGLTPGAYRRLHSASNGVTLDQN